MQVTVTTIVFGLPEGQRLLHIDLIFPEQTLTVHDLIARKVAQEVAEIEARQRPGLSGEYLTPEELIQAVTRESLRPGAVEDEVARAQQAFRARAYMIVIDEQRINNPEAVIHVQPETRIEFIKILPLVGG